jgi:hypothetical protein
MATRGRRAGFSSATLLIQLKLPVAIIGILLVGDNARGINAASFAKCLRFNRLQREIA